MKHSFYLLASALLISFTSCDKDNDTDGTRAAFSIRKASDGTMQQDAATVTNGTGGTFTFSKVMLGISEIDFEQEIGNEDQDYELKGPFRYDVLTQKSEPAIDVITIAPGTYHELEFELDKVLPNGKSIEIAGTYTQGATTYRFEFSSEMEEDFDIDNPEGIDAMVGKTAGFVLQLNLESLFSGIDFSRATTDNDSVIRINRSSNAQLATLIEGRIEEIMDFDRD